MTGSFKHTQAEDGSVARWFWITTGVLLFLHLALAWLLRTPAIGTGGDDAVYIQLAESLKHFRYQDSFLVGHPAHVKFPPGYPAFLAILSILGGGGMDHFQLFLVGGMIASVLALALVTDAVRRLASPQIAILVLLAAIANPRILMYAGMVMSEPLCLFFLALSVWAVSRESESFKWSILAGAAACAAALTRSAAVMMVFALLIYWLLARRYRRAAVLAVAAGVVIGGWALWTVIGPQLHPSPTGERYLADTFARTTLKGSVITRILERLFRNSMLYVTKLIPSQLPLPYTDATILDNLLAISAIVGCMLAGVWASWKRWRLLPVFVITYLGLLVVWPWPVTRFLTLALPFLYALLFIGAAWLGSRFGPRLRIALPAVFALVIAGASFWQLPDGLKTISTCDRANPETSAGCFREETREYLAIARWAKDSIPPGAVFVTVKEGTFAYLTGRESVPFFRVAGTDSSTALRQLRSLGATHIVLAQLARGERRLAYKLRNDCDQLSVTHQFSPVAMVLEIQPADAPPLPPAANACESLPRYVALLDAKHAHDQRPISEGDFPEEEVEPSAR